MSTRVLLVTQAYPPDTPAVGQHFQDVALGLAARGHAVTVLASARRYEDGARAYKSTVSGSGVKVIRIPMGSLGKRSIAVRLLGALLFQMQAFVRALFQRFDVLVVSTSPPLVAVAAAVVCALRRRPFVYWVMDINPEQLIVLHGKSANSPAMRLLRYADRFALRRAAAIVVLDTPMREIVARKLNDDEVELQVLSPWSHAEAEQASSDARRQFRARHGLETKFVIMYSGNHSHVHPLDSVLDAARMLHDSHPHIRFVFIGGGNAKVTVDQCELPNVVSLPYQPLEHLGASLGAADVHLVIVGDASVGLVHPSKIYSPMRLALPVIVIGPSHAPHVALVNEYRFGWAVPNAAPTALVAAILEADGMTAAERAGMGARGSAALASSLGTETLLHRFVDLVLATAVKRG